MTLQVLIADDQEMVRAGLRMIIETQPDMEVVAEASNGREAVDIARQTRPDVCLIDVRMPILDGISATRELAGPDSTDSFPVVMVTTFDLDEYVYDAIRAGARGFLLKDATAPLVAEAVRAAASGDALISPAITARLLERFAADPHPDDGLQQPAESLTEREEQVLLAVAHGLTNAEIAESLFVSVSTIKSHVNALLSKLGARNRVDLAVWAYRSGRISS